MNAASVIHLATVRNFDKFSRAWSGKNVIRRSYSSGKIVSVSKYGDNTLVCMSTSQVRISRSQWRW